MTLQTLFQSINTDFPPFPCSPLPGKTVGQDGRILSAVTASSQLRIRQKPGLEWKVYSPVLYQNCMRPEEIRVYPLTLDRTPEGNLRLDNSFRQAVVVPEASEIQISPWKAEFESADCSRCTSCGRCSW